MTTNSQTDQATREARIASEVPSYGIKIPTTSALEIAAYRMPNGSKFVTLVDGSEATWEAYCAQVAGH